MIRLSQIKLPVNHKKSDIDRVIMKKLGLKKVPAYKMVKQSIDARKKNDIQVIYTVELSLPNEAKVAKRCKQAAIVAKKEYQLPPSGGQMLPHPPVIVGMGPGGLFCAYQLAKAEYAPIVIERGEAVDDRAATVEHFWKTGELNTESNVQFGEGGAGTFSDGKLNTLVKDKFARNTYVLDTFVKHGAPEDILYTNKPHIGTDELRGVVRNMREAIIEMGGQVHFNTKLTDFEVKDGEISKIQINDSDWMDCGPVILAIGHSARDTFAMLHEKKVVMEPKPFAIGVRVEHPRTMINESQYGAGYPEKLLPTAAYKLTAKAANGRSVYSFCMCPGGYVVNASSEEQRLVVNGMSNHDRMAANSNSAIIVNVTPEDFGSEDVLAGVEFQRRWEESAYREGKGQIPVQLFKDFEADVTSTSYGDFKPCQKGGHAFGNLNNCLPKYCVDAIIDGLYQFEKKIKGYARPDTILSGVETRTSSPVRILRGDDYTSEITNLYPCGEGAGYAGGITSAAMDGMKVAEAVIRRYKPM